MGPVVEPDCKKLTGKLRGKKLLNSQRMSRGETDTDLGNQGAEGRKSQIYLVITILSMGHRTPRVRRNK